MHLGLCIYRPSSRGHMLRVVLAHYCWKVVMYLTSYSIIRLHLWLSGDFRLMLSHWPPIHPSVPCCSLGTFLHGAAVQKHLLLPFLYKKKREREKWKNVADKSRTPYGICVEQALGWNRHLVEWLKWETCFTAVSNTVVKLYPGCGGRWDTCIPPKEEHKTNCTYWILCVK